MATSNENFINRLEEIERPDNIAISHLKTAYAIRSQFGPLVDLASAYENKEDLGARCIAFMLGQMITMQYLRQVMPNYITV